MKDPLFKPAQDPLTPADEAEITRRLAEAYQEQEEAEKTPELQRIVKLVEETLASEFSETQPPDEPQG
jgi:uncharacterized membrane protein YqiK